MTKRTLLLLLALTACLAAAAAAAGDKEPSGKELYRSNCKICHGADSPAGEYTPMFLIQEQWERFFAEEYLPAHEAVADTLHDGAKVIDVITPDMLEKIRDFCIEGAADSEHPMTCG